MNNYEKFKFLLEYFVSHLEWVVNKDKKHIGFSHYIDPLIKNGSFKKAGRGWKRESIQQQVTQWENYNNNIVCINITATNYKGTSSYLNWDGTWINVRPRWDKNHINKLYISQEENNSAPAIIETDINDLGLFDKKITNDKLIVFFNTFYGLINKYNIMKRSEKYISLIESNHNLILTGAPGTGKTYLAKQVARLLLFGKTNENELTDEEREQFNEQCGFVQFHPSYDYTDFVEGLRPIQDDKGNVGFKRKNGIFKDFCEKAIPTTLKFCYFQLIQDIESSQITTIKLKSGKDSEKLSIKDGTKIKWKETQSDKSSTHNVNLDYLIKLFEKFDTIEKLNRIDDINKEFNAVIGRQNHTYYWAVLNELLRRMKKYVFIIDEINRGEISKIFGELFFSIDPSYRGEKGLVNTQYQNLIPKEGDIDFEANKADVFRNGFYVPENVYIIGTMNDIDRSVESMDFAFRRRFAFKEIKATDRVDMLDDLQDIKDDAVNRMNNLNAEIEKIEGLSAAYHIGPAYFLKLNNYNGYFEQLWENHLKGLLFEYMRGMQKEQVEENMKKLKDAYDLKTTSNEQSTDNNNGQ